MRRAKLGETIEERGTNLQLYNLAIEVTCHPSLTELFETSHLGLDQTTPVVTTLLFPNRPSQTLGRARDLIAGTSPRATVFPRLRILAHRNPRRGPRLAMVA